MILLYARYSNSKTVKVECKFDGENSCNRDNPGIVCCDVKNGINVTSESDEVNIETKYSQRNQNVGRIFIDQKEVVYFPNGFGKEFKTVFAITIRNSNLMKIAKKSFPKFPDLKYLDLSYN